MITIRFSQCGTDFQQDEISFEGNNMPIYDRAEFYAKILSTGAGDFRTVDEHMILIAMQMHRHKKIELKLIEVCACKKAENECPIDKNGDFVIGPWHDFFNIRLKYLY